MAQIQFVNHKRKIYYVFNFFSIELDRLMDINTEKLPLITNLLFLLAIFLEFSLMQGFYKYPIIAATTTILAMAVWSRYENYKRTYYTMSVNDYLYDLQYGFERDIYSYICVANTYVWYENGSRVLLEPGSYFMNPKLLPYLTFLKSFVPNAAIS